MRDDLLRQLIREMSSVVLYDGDEVEFGSERHIKDLEHDINRLTHKRNRISSPANNRKRTDLTRAIGSLRAELRRAKRHGVKNGLIKEGGRDLMTEAVAAHIMNIYEALDLTIGDLYDLIEDIHKFEVEEIQEKLDGQNYNFTVIDGELRFLGKGADWRTVQRGGLNRQGIETKYESIPGVQAAFVSAYDALAKAIGKMNPASVESLFQNGAVVIMAEAITPENPNTVIYDRSHVRFIKPVPVLDDVEVDQAAYDELTNVSEKEMDEAGRSWEIGAIPILRVAEEIDAGEPGIEAVTSKLDALVTRLDLSDDDTIADLVVPLVRDHLSKEGFIPDHLLDAASRRVGLGDKKSLDKKTFVKATSLDGWKKLQELESLRSYFVAKALIPLEEIIQDLGIYVMRSLEFAVASNSTDSGSSLRDFVKRARSSFESGKVLADPRIMKKIQVELERIGGREDLFEKSVEGVVFRWRGRLFKLTGMFTPMHRLKALFTFRQGKLDPARFAEARNRRRLLEGGNVFHATSGELLTTGIRKEDVNPTLKQFFSNALGPVLEKQVGPHAKKAGFITLGSTGKKSISGDLDIGILSPADTPAEMRSYRKLIATELGAILGADHVKQTGQNIHVMYPIVGSEGYVQIDIMFSSDLKGTEWLMSGVGDVGVKGVYRNLLLALIAKRRSEEESQETSRDVKITMAAPGGVQKKVGNDVVISRTSDPKRILDILRISAAPKDIASFESLVKIMLADETMRYYLAGFEEYISHRLASDEENARHAITVLHDIVQGGTQNESALRNFIRDNL